MAEGVTPVRMPDLGEVGAAVVVEWLVDVGGAVVEGDDLVEVETEKTTFVIPAPASGRLGAIRVPAGGTARVEDVLGSIDGA